MTAAQIAKQLITRIEQKKAVIGVVGLGYVGLPLLLAFTEKEFQAIGFDVDESKIKALNKGTSYIRHIAADPIKRANKAKRVLWTSDFRNVKKCDAILICVPTPLNTYREPDMSYIVNTAKMLAPYVCKNQLFVLESTTYPGTTREVLEPILESETGLKANKDFFTAFSPEREDPNNAKYTTVTIPKVIGADIPEAGKVAQALYGSVIVRTVPVSSSATAEATKLMENIFRCVNIALVNELKVVFDKMGINIWEVIDAANTKPFGFMPFYPGPGLGGHCIPIDPFYLTWKAREFNCATRFIELAGEVNTAMPDYVVAKTMEALNEVERPMKNSRILMCGLAYKKNVDDVRESPAFRVWELLEKQGAKVCYHDPYCPEVPMTREHKVFAGIKSTPINAKDRYDAIVVVTDHANVDYALFHKMAKVVVDTRNMVPPAKNVIKA